MSLFSRSQFCFLRRYIPVIGFIAPNAGLSSWKGNGSNYISLAQLQHIACAFFIISLIFSFPSAQRLKLTKVPNWHPPGACALPTLIPSAELAYKATCVLTGMVFLKELVQSCAKYCTRLWDYDIELRGSTTSRGWSCCHWSHCQNSHWLQWARLSPWMTKRDWL